MYRKFLAWSLTLLFFIIIPFLVVAPLGFNELNVFEYFISIPMIIIISYQFIEFASVFFNKGPIHLNCVHFPSITVIVVAYLPNEQGIIMETLNYYKTLLSSYEGECNMVLAYNTPVDLDIEGDIFEFAGKEEKWFYPLKVPGSRSKSENINYALDQEYIHKIVGIYDTDHHPRADSLERAGYWIKERGFDFVQGRNIIRDKDHTVLEMLVKFDFDMMYALFHNARYSLSGIALFGGSNGYWKKSAIKSLKFRTIALTEDIDCSIRALIAGYRGYFDKYLVSSEEAPPNIDALWTQRTRWTQGWTEVSMWFLIPVLRSQFLGAWQKFHLFFLLGVREIFVYFQIFGLPIFIVESIKSNGIDIDFFTFAVTVYSLFYYPILVFCIYLVSEWGEWRGRWWQLLSATLINALAKSVWNPVLSLYGHARHLCKMNKWVVTSRGVDNLQPVIEVDTGTV